MTMAGVDAEVLVVGAGPAGLAVAACLLRRGIDTLVVDRGGFTGRSGTGPADETAHRLALGGWRTEVVRPGAQLPELWTRLSVGLGVRA